MLFQMIWLHAATLAAILFCVTNGFYVPGVAPRNFKMGDPVDIKVRLFADCLAAILWSIEHFYDITNYRNFKESG